MYTFFVDLGGKLTISTMPLTGGFSEYTVTLYSSTFDRYVVAHVEKEDGWVGIKYFSNMTSALQSAAQFRRHGAQAIALYIPKGKGE